MKFEPRRRPRNSDQGNWSASESELWLLRSRRLFPVCTDYLEACIVKFRPPTGSAPSKTGINSIRRVPSSSNGMTVAFRFSGPLKRTLISRTCRSDQALR